MKILVDMNRSPGWVVFLAGAGYDAVHWSKVGPGTETDSELMDWAAERGYVILTADLDFGAMLAAPAEPARASFRYAAILSRRVRPVPPSSAFSTRQSRT